MEVGNNYKKRIMNLKQMLGGIFLSSMVIFTSCNDDEVTPLNLSSFTITIENVFEGKDYFANGTTGLIEPGMSESFSFNAGKGQYLSFATMFVQSNDLFYGPDENGIALYDSDGNPVTGDQTALIDLWDAGTEVNEAPGEGANQPPRQSDPNTGMDENSTVKDIEDVNDGFSYPADAEVVRVSLAHDGGTLFTVTIENISEASSVPTPLAPGVWVINTKDQTPLFTEESASSEALERIAEDGDNSLIDGDLTEKSGFVSPFAPGAYGINKAVFTSGETASTRLESLAEDGDSSGFSKVFNTPVGGGTPGPIFPGDSYSFEIIAQEGDVLSFATMLVQSNDWFIGANDIELFANSLAITGDITSMVKLYDSGTEVDEYAGAGINQPVRQSAANTGVDEDGTIGRETNASSNVPEVAEMVKITISR